MFGGLYFSKTYFCGASAGVLVPPIPPVPPVPPGPTKAGYGGPISLRERQIEYDLWLDRQYELLLQRLLEQQNADDLEVVQILTEFLSRT